VKHDVTGSDSDKIHSPPRGVSREWGDVVMVTGQ